MPSRVRSDKTPLVNDVPQEVDRTLWRLSKFVVRLPENGFQTECSNHQTNGTSWVLHGPKAPTEGSHVYACSGTIDTTTSRIGTSFHILADVELPNRQEYATVDPA
jgi:hypothetical protein